MGYRDEGPAAGEERSYTPHALGNRKSDEPMRVVLRNPNESQRRRFYLEQKVGTRLSGDGKPVTRPDGTPWVEMDVRGSDEWRRLAISQCVVRVEGYDRRGAGGAWVGVTTADDFYTYARREFVDEISEEIVTGYSLTEDERGKSEGSSDSMSLATQVPSGIAESAGSNGSVSNGAATGQRQIPQSSLPEQRIS